MEEVKEHVKAQKEIQGLWYQEVHGHVHWTREVVSDLREQQRQRPRRGRRESFLRRNMGQQPVGQGSEQGPTGACLQWHGLSTPTGQGSEPNT